MRVLIDTNIVLAGLDAIVTRNPADFAAAPLPVLSPAELLTRLRLPPKP